jgi:hypothetical protein
MAASISFSTYFDQQGHFLNKRIIIEFWKKEKHFLSENFYEAISISIGSPWSIIPTPWAFKALSNLMHR